MALKTIHVKTTHTTRNFKFWPPGPLGDAQNNPTMGDRYCYDLYYFYHRYYIYIASAFIYTFAQKCEKISTVLGDNLMVTMLYEQAVYITNHTTSLHCQPYSIYVSSIFSHFNIVKAALKYLNIKSCFLKIIRH